MWNSPRCSARKGKRYRIEEIAALTYPLDLMLHFLESIPVQDVVHERILQRMDKEELIFAIHEVLQSLLEDIPIPSKGHTGYQEAIIAELLFQTYVQIGCELDDPESGDSARKAAWQSLHQLCINADATEGGGLWQLEDLRLNFSSPRIHRSKKITPELWEDLLLGEGGLRDEFLWDDDWRMDELLDLPNPVAKKVTGTMGLDLDVVHKLPPTPTRAQYIMAEHYIKYVIWKDEAGGDR